MLASVLAWPWEALRDPQPLATACRIERRLDGIRAVDLPAELPKDHIHILLVTARPYQGDVEYRSLSRPLVDLIEERQLPARVTVLRPPTFDALREHLRRGHYHLVHFDGHGAYGHRGDPESVSGHRLRAHQGRLIFEDEDGDPAPVEAEQLSALLREHRIPMMVLNACQSATHAEGSEDVFASVATALLRAGVRSVVAMAYSLFVSGGRVFLPAFYRRLFETGNPSEAVRAGRQQMFQDKRRLSARGPYPLEDWLVPVLYQLDAPVLPFAARAAAPEAAPGPALPEEARDSENPYGFIGRDGAILALERALRRRPAGILIHGLGGVGKTTLARGLLHWLGATSGLGEGVFWFTFQDIRNSEYVINRLVERLFGTEAMTVPTAQKLEALIKTLKAHRVLIVWDNFESVSGIPGVIEGHLPPEDRAHLAALLKGLRGGQSKILITNRSEEAWLGREHCFKLPLGGLHGEERWAFCTTILKDLGLSAKQDDQDLADLMALLDGHPLAMRALLPGLAEHSAKRLTDIVKGHLGDFPAEDPAQQKLFATLRFVEETLPERLRPLLVPIGLHERYLDANHLEQMAKTAQIPDPRADIGQCLTALGTAGLVHDRGQARYELHPALTGFLRSHLPVLRADTETEAWRRAFVNTLGRLADRAAPQPKHILRAVFHYHEANLQTALELAEALAMHGDIGALLQALGAHAQAQRHFPEAARYYARLAELRAHTRGEGEHLAAAYHQLGTVAEEQRDFPTAEAWYRKSLAIKEKQGNERGAAQTYHQLGSIAEEQRDFTTAEAWYRKSLAIFEKQGNEHGAAPTYDQLGRIAEEQRDFQTAEAWYLKSLAIEEKQRNEHGAAITYHQLGMIAQKQRDFPTAEAWYRKALVIDEKQANEHGAASTYHQLGTIAEGQRDFPTAEAWYRKSLAISEKHGEEHGAAITYHQLGSIAQEQGDFITAEAWYRKSLAIFEKQGNEHGAAQSYGMMGLLARQQDKWVEAARWLIKSIRGSMRTNDERSTQAALGALLPCYQRAPDNDQQAILALWDQTGLGPFPEIPGD